MFAAFFLTAFPTFATLILGWLFGAAVIATLFLLRHLASSAPNTTSCEHCARRPPAPAGPRRVAAGRDRR